MIKPRKISGFLLVFLCLSWGFNNAEAQNMTQTKADCEELMNAALPFAKQMLQQHGEFFPYGSAMAPDGKITQIGGYDGREHPPSAEIISLLKDGFKQGAKEKKYKATALVYDVRTTLADGGKSDAIAIALDHEANYSVVVLFPYKLQDGELQVGQITGHKGTNEIFGSDSH